jgi:hypothetical protein
MSLNLENRGRTPLTPQLRVAIDGAQVTPMLSKDRLIELGREWQANQTQIESLMARNQELMALFITQFDKVDPERSVSNQEWANRHPIKPSSAVN